MDDSPVIIGISGYAGAGKDVLAQAICADYGFVSFSYAAKLKEILSDLYDVPIEFFNDRELKNLPHPKLNGMSPRRAAQLIGTQGFRNMINPMTWVNYVDRRIDAAVDAGQSVVITDVRFLEEENAIAHRPGGFMVGLQRKSVEVYNHDSEIHIPTIHRNCDVIVSNDGSIADLVAHAGRIVRIAREVSNPPPRIQHTGRMGMEHAAKSASPRIR